MTSTPLALVTALGLAALVASPGNALAADPATANAASANAASANAASANPVTVDNFARAESDLYFRNIAKDGFGQFSHRRQLASIDRQPIIRLNRDTLYSAAVFDLDAGPVTVTLPDPGKRFLSLQAINEDHYIPVVAYGGATTLTREQVGTRYVAVAIRTFVDPADAGDVAQVHALQDAIQVEQPGGPGRFEVPQWDPVSQKKVRDALLVLAATILDFNRAFGSRDEVHPVRHLVGSAAAWGGNPDKDATYLNITPSRNDGATIYRLTVKDVPVAGFWSVSLYNAQGYYEKNPQDAYSLNNITARKGADGVIAVQFGGCDGAVPNCLPIVKGWNYTVRLYRPSPAILDGSWTFPVAVPVD